MEDGREGGGRWMEEGGSREEGGGRREEGGGRKEEGGREGGGHRGLSGNYLLGVIGVFWVGVTGNYFFNEGIQGGQLINHRPTILLWWGGKAH